MPWALGLSPWTLGLGPWPSLGPPVPLSPVLVLGLGRGPSGSAYQLGVCRGRFRGLVGALVGLAYEGSLLLRFGGQSGEVQSTLVAAWLHLLSAAGPCYAPKQSPRPLGLWDRGLAVDGACGAYRARFLRSIHPNTSSRHSSASIVPPTPTMPTT